MGQTHLSHPRVFIPVLFTYFIDNFGLALVYPIFTPLFLHPNFMIISPDLPIFHRTLLLGLLIASFPLAQFFGAPIIGELSDHKGRKKIFIGTIIGGIIGYILTGMGIHLKALFLLWIGRFCTGFFAGNLTLCLATVADISKTHEERVRNFGWVGAVGGVSFILAIITGGSFYISKLSLSPGTAFFITAFLSLINLSLMLFMFQESFIPKTNGKVDLLKGIYNLASITRSRKLRVIYLSYFLFMMCWVSSMQFLSDYLLGRYAISLHTLTLIFMGIGLTWSLSNFVINPLLTQIFQAKKSFYFALLGLSSFLLIAFFTPSFPYFILAFFGAVICGALSWTNGLATVSLSASDELQGSTLGLNQSVAAIASILGPIVGGIIAGISTHYIFLFSALSALLATLILNLYFFRKTP